VGVVKDSHTGSVDQIEPVVYAPFNDLGIPKILVESSDAATIESVRSAAAQIEPRSRMQVQPLRNNLDRWLQGARVGAEIAGGLGLFALVLATVGISGVFAYVVQHRTKEIGIRMALGAKSGQVIRLVLGASSRAVAVGSILGFAIALPASHFMRNVVYGVSPLDPLAYLFVAVILGAAGIAASYAPARRAARVDPLSALRHD
jgi:ABC-type lipoprotein release transport system permease subunit